MKIPVASPVLNGNEKKYVNDCIDTTWISSKGKYIDEFEKRFAKFVGAKHAIAVANGTVALHVALLALNIQPGDEVIMPTLSYIATANSAKYCGAKPVFIDSEDITMNMDVQLIESKITKKTKVIMPVHLYGHSVDMAPILKLARKYNLFVVEDAAEGVGAYYKGKHVGPLGTIGTFSFFGNKNITTGEGGMLVTNNSRIADRIRILKGQGMDPKKRYWHPIIGYNYRMTNIQAAIGLAQLENIKWHLKKRREIAALYDKELRSEEDKIQLPISKAYAKNGFWMYSIILKDTVKLSRDKVMRELEKKGIETRPIFYPVHTMPPYFEGAHKYPVAEKLASRGINLPTHGRLSINDILYVIRSLKAVINK